jgi:hypothetical protein
VINDEHQQNEPAQDRSNQSGEGAAETNPATNQVADPPLFGSGKNCQFQTIEWCELDCQNPSQMSDQLAIIPRGMAVHEKLRGEYWHSRKNIEDAIRVYTAAHIDPPWPYFLLDEHDRPVGYGLIDAQADVDDAAWISCMFLERRLRTAFPTAELINKQLCSPQAVNPVE